VDNTDPSNPIISMSPNYEGNANLVLVGTIGSGTWEGAVIEYAFGGTGLSSLGTAGQVLATNAGATAMEWITVGGGGTVTSVGLSLPSILTVSGSPVTTSGTLSATLAVQNANKVFAGPTTGADAAPTFRTLVAADIPALPYSPVPTNTSFTSQTSVSVTHSKGYYPLVQVIDGSGFLISPLNVEHTSTNTFVVTFSVATTGVIINI